jgi:hypothetical protein
MNRSRSMVAGQMAGLKGARRATPRETYMEWNVRFGDFVPWKSCRPSAVLSGARNGEVFSAPDPLMRLENNREK